MAIGMERQSKSVHKIWHNDDETGRSDSVKQMNFVSKVLRDTKFIYTPARILIRFTCKRSIGSTRCALQLGYPVDAFTQMLVWTPCSQKSECKQWYRCYRKAKARTIDTSACWVIDKPSMQLSLLFKLVLPMVANCIYFTIVGHMRLANSYIGYLSVSQCQRLHSECVCYVHADSSIFSSFYTFR